MLLSSYSLEIDRECDTTSLSPFCHIIRGEVASVYVWLKGEVGWEVTAHIFVDEIIYFKCLDG
jgi:hypothetical protein